MAFKYIKGQNRAVEILKKYLSSSKLSGAYLFAGQPMVGKYLAARQFAKAVNCQNSQDDSCDSCPSCLKIDKGQHPDVHFIEPEASESIKIDSIRLLKSNIGLRPYEARKKVFVINDAHNLTPEAANALLKILEEPPESSLIILVSARPDIMLKTVVSRCKTIKFYPLNREELADILRNDFRVETGRAHFLAYFSEGRIGQALRLKDTDILSEKNRIIDDFISARKAPGVDNLPAQERQAVRDSLNILAAWFRDIYIIKAGLAGNNIINLDRKAELCSLGVRYSVFELEEIMRLISDSLLYLQQNVNTKLLLSNIKAGLWKEKYS